MISTKSTPKMGKDLYKSLKILNHVSRKMRRYKKRKAQVTMRAKAVSGMIPASYIIT